MTGSWAPLMKSAACLMAGRSTETLSLGSGGGLRVVQELDGRGVRRKPAGTSSWRSINTGPEYPGVAGRLFSFFDSTPVLRHDLWFCSQPFSLNAEANLSFPQIAPDSSQMTLKGVDGTRTSCQSRWKPTSLQMCDVVGILVKFGPSPTRSLSSQ
jgi:hypothetical protein